MGFEFDRPAKMGPADQMAQVVPAGLVLGDQAKPIDHRILARRHAIARDGQEGADQRLDASILAGPGEGHGTIKPVAIGNRDGRESPVLSQFRGCLGIDRPVEHGKARKDAQRDETFKGHAG